MSKKGFLTVLICCFGVLGLALWAERLQMQRRSARLGAAESGQEEGPDSPSGMHPQAGHPEETLLRHYISGQPYLHWAPRHPDTTRWLCELTIHENMVMFWFHGQCQYKFLTEQSSDTTLDLAWSYTSDCPGDLDFLGTSYGLSRPACGESFARITLLRDTSLQVQYHFPEWIDRVNAQAGDSLFPKLYYPAKQGGGLWVVSR